jgi:23S rRNA pseudouridine955/2504/2580 synthase
VLGDDKYGEEAANSEARALGLKRMYLHAHSCSFTWPDGAEQSFSAPLPDELRAVLDQLSSKRRAQPRARR